MLRSAFLSFFFLLPFVAFAAVSNFGSSLEIGISPEHPQPGTIVLLTVSDPSGDAGNTSYVWGVNGRNVQEGIGKVSLSLTAGALGSTQTIKVSAVEGGEVVREGTIVVRPSSVDAIWEGDTATPPFYMGRPLPNGQSSITAIAMPHVFQGGKEVAASSLVYRWEINGTFSQKQSGYGKSSIIITPPRFGSAFSVSVEVSTRDGAATAKRTVSVEPKIPEILIYENAPLLGIRFEKALSGTLPFPGEELSFIAYPLFVNDLHTLSMTWSLDGKPFAVNSTRPNAATFRKVGEGKGTHAVQVSFDNPSNFLENGEKVFQLSF